MRSIQETAHQNSQPNPMRYWMPYLERMLSDPELDIYRKYTIGKAIINIIDIYEGYKHQDQDSISTNEN
jgi:hypothetical protein